MVVIINNELERRIDTLKDVINHWYKESEGDDYIKLLYYIILSKKANRIPNIETLDLMIGELCIILKTTQLRKSFDENFMYRENILKQEKRKEEEKKEFDRIIKLISEKNNKYNINKHLRDIFSNILNKQIEDCKIVSLSNEDANEIFNIWNKEIIKSEDFYYIINLIKIYCKSKGLDYILALYSIYIKNQFHYYCRYSDHKKDYDHCLQVGYFERGYLMEFVFKRIRDKYNGEIKGIAKIEDDIANMFNKLDDNTNDNNGYFNITHAKNHNFTAFHFIRIDIIVKYNSYTAKLEDIINKSINEAEKEERKMDIENTPKKREPLKTNIAETELKRIYNELVEQKYISCNEDLFLSCFGYKKEDKEDKIVWMKIKTEFEIFISEIVQKEKNIVNNKDSLPRKKINSWFIDKNFKEIEAVKKISCGVDTYKIYNIIYP